MASCDVTTAAAPTLTAASVLSLGGRYADEQRRGGDCPERFAE
jgi:hypothetical protein